MKCLIEERSQIRLGAWGCHLADRLLCCPFLTVPAVKGSIELRTVLAVKDGRNTI